MAWAILSLHVETLTMSRKERERMTIMAGVKSQELSQVQAAELMGLGYRQAKRIWRRYQDEGDAGLVHRLRGKPGLRHKPLALRAQVLARCAEERYADFGPTLMAEELEKEGLVVDHDTLRRWLLAAGKADRAASAPAAPAMAGAQAVLWGDGATGRLAP